MAPPTSGALTLANIQTEFGGANPISLSEYYAGGAYVPAGTSVTYDDGTVKEYTDRVAYVDDFPDREADCDAMGWV